ncbi:adenosine receptor A1-like [Stegodyphus dumicola]|uniref:adenosine receptor A1-like n=1 Tax=Stegodyphus dumicola TaxID=202533 RepID=UPI0015B13D4A|nr:adenosine receptor A1-like [Stegodyphus dumicola]
MGQDELPLTYAICEVAVAILAIAGNLLVVATFALERRLRRVTNLYIISLATSDFLVGLIGVPSAVMARLGLPRNAFQICLLMLSVLVLLCTVSILNLVAVTLDRYWAILHPFCYKRTMNRRAAGIVILGCWILGSLVGLLPIFGWNNGPEKDGRCLFIPVMHYDFLVLIFFATIVYPALLMAFCYGRIYAVVLKQVRISLYHFCTSILSQLKV